MSATAAAIRRRKRSKSGARSRNVTLLNDERSPGSRSTVHMRASASVIRRGDRTGRGGRLDMAGKLPRATPGHASPRETRTTVELVAAGHVLRDPLQREPESARDGRVLQLVH